MNTEGNSTLFASYYDPKGKLQKITMSEMSELISNEENKAKIADWVYHRLYDRFLKPFFFDEDPEFKKHKELVTIFKQQYKHGFAIMTNCCLLVETLAAFLEGSNRTTQGGKNSYISVFDKAKIYNNDLEVFRDTAIYSAIRCGLLHQAETYENFIIRRGGAILYVDGKTINATLFAKAFKKFLESYKNELTEEKWDSELWDNCRKKIRHIISNSKKKT
ncbi:MAG: hypothetical protein LC107_08565 [Chitinophagales bacterium]|nr:hypothetical protein [Chitinophagales bacterium]